jgi:molybdenum cofactor guanylyltransferase
MSLHALPPGSSTPLIQASGIILAGGRSERMGTDKRTLVLHSETLLSRTVRVLSEIVDEILITGMPANADLLPGTRSIRDAMPDAGPLAGLLAGLRAMRHGHAVAVACDHPFLDAQLLRALLRCAPGYNAVVPRVDGRPEPTHAVYGAEAADSIAQCLASGKRSLRGALAELHVRWVEEDELRCLDPQLRSFVNVNTREQWEAVLLGLD